jgi:hypothetical protein
MSQIWIEVWVVSLMSPFTSFSNHILINNHYSTEDRQKTKEKYFQTLSIIIRAKIKQMTERNRIPAEPAFK